MTYNRNRNHYCCPKCKTWCVDLCIHFGSDKSQACEGNVAKADGLMSLMKHTTKYLSEFKKTGTVPSFCQECDLCVTNIRYGL